MSELRYTLLCDGSSDQALQHVLNWLLRAHRPEVEISPECVVRCPRSRLSEQIDDCLELYPCDILFIHRDAEGAERATRVSEIGRAWDEAHEQGTTHCCVVPVRMTEAWLLFNENAIRRAAGNPAGDTPVDLPCSPDRLPNPKSALHELIRTASGLNARRRKSLDVHAAVHRVAELITDYSPLRKLSAFAEMERELAEKLA
jgi:hypothetical protein